MSKNEDYKYIIISCSLSNFYTIFNLSSSTCPIFGYTKEELIGRPFDILLPEIYCSNHRQMLQNKLDEFKKKLLIKNVKMRSDSWIEDSFGRNKMKYLVHYKVRWTLVSSEEEIIYGIGKIITESKTLQALEQDIVYVLTDKELIIQSFTPNGPKLLLFHS
jgi:PAS domain S-box-containing protein